MATRKTIALGMKVKEAVTGYVGVVTGIATYLTGCTQALVVPEKLDKDGDMRKGEWLDVERLTVIPGRVKLATSPTGGPQSNQPRRATPPRR